MGRGERGDWRGEDRPGAGVSRVGRRRGLGCSSCGHSVFSKVESGHFKSRKLGAGGQQARSRHPCSGACERSRGLGGRVDQIDAGPTIALRTQHMDRFSHSRTKHMDNGR